MRLRSGIKTILFVTLIVLMAATLAQESFSAGQIVIDTMTVAGLKNNKLGDPDTRDIAIYLPPSYDFGL